MEHEIKAKKMRGVNSMENAEIDMEMEMAMEMKMEIAFEIKSWVIKI